VRLTWALLLWSLSSHAQGSFVALLNMGRARIFHTATRLNDGRVLIAGGVGVDALTSHADAELFDPKTNAFFTIAMAHARAGHTASLLNDGTVLVVGGRMGQGEGLESKVLAVDSVELFHSGPDSFSSLAALRESRSAHSATVLPNGDVLIVGGTSEKGLRSSCELFQMKTKRTTSCAPLPEARAFHSAVCVGNDVYVFGGRTAHGTSETGVIFQGKNQRWIPMVSMFEPREKTQAVARKNDVAIVGGQTRTSRTNLSEVFSKSKWRPLENHLSMALAGHSVTLLTDEDLLIVGGETPASIDSERAQRWVAASRQWCLAGALKAPRKNHSATLLQDGRVLIVGGTSQTIVESSAEIWTPNKGECQTAPVLDLP
jgi:hypothetical protein